MTSLTPDRFDDFFHATYGYNPFPWQSRLGCQVAGSQTGDPCWPEVLALPTAAGKTAGIDMAVFALACQANRPANQRTAPRRVFFVVDRRVIVDQAFDHAQRLADKLEAATDGILKVVADQLRELSGEKRPLACFQLRGGMYRDDVWVRSPLQPTIITSTVDQFGSRLLFRGYGPSSRMWPIHAGLAANDSLVFLDEAHCSNPFRQTINAVRRYRQWSGESNGVLSAPFHLTVVTATPPPEVQEVYTFRLEIDDRCHPVLGPRLSAAKPATLARPVDVRNLTEEEALKRLSQRIAEEALNLQSEGRHAIGIIVNRVATAQMVHQILNEPGENGERRLVLLTGRMRPIDKDNVIQQLEPLKSSSAARAEYLEHPIFVVATQTLEVGADLDFDGLVTECASLDALRQRFGRLNRTGRDIEARATIVVRADQSNPRRGEEDPIYGRSLAETWQWLKEHAQKDEIDLGQDRFDKLLPADPDERATLLNKLVPPAPDAPVMLPAHVDAWVQTAPIPLPSPDVSLFLHGAGRGVPEEQVCWRADLVDRQQERWIDVLSLCHPTSPECISVPIYRLRRWFSGQDLGTNLSDVEGGKEDEETQRQSAGRHYAVRWRGPEDSEVITNARDLRPGDTVVIPAGPGSWESFGHFPNGLDGSEPIMDLGDRAHLQARAVPVLRINSEIMKSWPDCTARDRLENWAEASDVPGDPSEVSEVFDLIRELSHELEGADMQYHWLRVTSLALATQGQQQRRSRHPTVAPHPEGGLVITGKSRLSREEYRTLWNAEVPVGKFTSEDDASSATVEVDLETHLLGVEDWAKRFGQGVGLPDPVVDDLALAAKLHDVGKADPRFQTLLHGGNRWAAESAEVLLAKSGGAAHQPPGAPASGPGKRISPGRPPRASFSKYGG